MPSWKFFRNNFTHKYNNFIWIKHLSLAVVLIIAAAYFLLANGPIYKPSKEKKTNSACLKKIALNLKEH